MAEFKVVVVDSPSMAYEHFYTGLKELTDTRDVEVVIVPPGTSREESFKICEDADGIIFSYFFVDEEFLGHLKKCKVISRTGIGMNTIDIPACTRHGIYVVNVREPQTVDVANHVAALILCCAKKICKANKMVREGVWQLEPLAPIGQLTGKTVGLYGFGRIAHVVAKRMLAFDMRVIACDPFLPDEEFVKNGVERVDLDTLIAESDFLSLHMPHTPTTEKIVNAETFKKMKKTAYLINCARGGLVDEDALVEALKSGEIAGAGLDTIWSEHPTPDMPIFSCENAVITPHAAWYSVECDRDLLVDAAKNLADSLLGKPMNTLCNPELLK